MSQTSLTWPDDKKCALLNTRIFESHQLPFGVSVYNRNEPISDFVGREKELLQFKDQLHIVMTTNLSLAVRLEGPGGVGKSTLFNYLKQCIEKERSSASDSAIQFLQWHDIDIFSTYFNIPEQIAQFRDLWKGLIDGLQPEFERETGYDLSFPEYIAYKVIYCMLCEDPETVEQIIWGTASQYNSSQLKHLPLKDLIEPLQKQGGKAVQALQAYIQANKFDLRKKFSTTIHDKKYELTRTDTEILMHLFRVIDEDDPDNFHQQILEADSRIFETNDTLIKYFNDLMRIYCAFSKKRGLLLIGIEEAVKSDPDYKTEYYQNLGNFFVRLRNQLNDCLFVFISTTEDWASFDQALHRFTDLQSQINSFMMKMALQQLNDQEMLQVFKKRMDRFWNSFSHERSTLVPSYPFTDAAFEYFIHAHDRNLRKTLHFLHSLWSRFRQTHTVDHLETTFDAMRVYLSTTSLEFHPKQLHPYDWKAIRRSFEDPRRYATPTQRSALIEHGFESLWRIYMNAIGSPITKVQNNPIFQIDGVRYRPDILVEINGNFGAERRRRIEFQVKAYSSGNPVLLKHIDSSLTLFQQGVTDCLYFLLIGSELAPDAETAILQLEQTYLNRIRRPRLVDPQINLLYLLAIFDEVVGQSLDQLPHATHLAHDLLEDLLGQSPETFLLEMEMLTFRSPTTATILELGQLEVNSKSSIEAEHGTLLDFIGSPPSITSSSVSSFTSPPIGSPSMSTPATKENISTWWQEYPDFATFRYELSALCQYLKDRETGKYQFQFTTSTVEKNVINPDASLNKKTFRYMLDMLEQQGYLTKSKSSYRLTKLGEMLYCTVKKYDYIC